MSVPKEPKQGWPVAIVKQVYTPRGSRTRPILSFEEPLGSLYLTLGHQRYVVQVVCDTVYVRPPVFEVACKCSAVTAEIEMIEGDFNDIKAGFIVHTEPSSLD